MFLLEAAAPQGNSLLTLIPNLLVMGGIFVVFYFLLIRPQKKKEKAVKNMLSALKPGDRVTTIGGIFGTVHSIKDDIVTIAVGSAKTQFPVARWGIRSVDEVSIENDDTPMN